MYIYSSIFVFMAAVGGTALLAALLAGLGSAPAVPASADAGGAARGTG
jgi:hypothetical protein